MKGLQDHGMIVIAKHFSITGATVLAMKNGLPLIEASIDSIKTLPFLELFKNKLGGVMPAASAFPLFYQDKDLVRKNEYDARTISLFFSGKWMQ